MRTQKSDSDFQADHMPQQSLERRINGKKYATERDTIAKARKSKLRKTVTNSLPAKNESLDHCNELLYSHQLSSPSSSVRNTYAGQFRDNSSPGRNLGASTVCSYCAYPRSSANYGVSAKKTIQSYKTVYMTSEPGLIAIKNGDDQAILLKCSCKECTKLSKNRNKPNRHSQKLPRFSPTTIRRQRTKASKIGKHRKPLGKKSSSGKSNKSGFSSATRLTLFVSEI